LMIGKMFLLVSMVSVDAGPIFTVSAKAPSLWIAVTGPIGRSSDAGSPSPTTRPPPVAVVSTEIDRPLTVTLLPSPFTLTLFCWITLVCDETLLCWITLVCDQAELTASNTVPTTTAAHILYLI
jgi:hypothetical protein